MKTLSIVLLLSFTPLALIAEDACEAHKFSKETVQQCPYAKNGLTWEIATASNHLSIEIARSSETVEEWEVIAKALKNIAYNFPQTNFDRDEAMAQLSIQRGAMTDEMWIETLHVVEKLCREVISTLKASPETKMITLLNSVKTENR
jgi:hypothetical protein